MFFLWFSNRKRIQSVHLHNSMHKYSYRWVRKVSDWFRKPTTTPGWGILFMLSRRLRKLPETPGVEFCSCILIGVDFPWGSFWLVKSDICQSITFENRSTIFSYIRPKASPAFGRRRFFSIGWYAVHCETVHYDWSKTIQKFQRGVWNRSFWLDPEENFQRAASRHAPCILIGRCIHFTPWVDTWVTKFFIVGL